MSGVSLSLAHEAALVLKKCGAGKDFWVKIINDPKFSQKLVDLYAESTSLGDFKKQTDDFCDAIDLIVECCSRVKKSDVSYVFKKAEEKVRHNLSEEHQKILDVLYNSQIETLRSRGCPESVIGYLNASKHDLLLRASYVDIPEGNIPFIPVIPRSFVGIYSLMPMIQSGDTKGSVNIMLPDEICDNKKSWRQPYFMCNVNIGDEFVGKSLEDVECTLSSSGGYALTVDEIIALCIHTNIAEKRDVIALGSYQNNTEKIYGIACLAGESTSGHSGLWLTDNSGVIILPNSVKPYCHSRLCGALNSGNAYK